jgi:hypothetical protein
MKLIALDAAHSQAVDVDSCNTCQGFWFDQYESSRITAHSVVALFKEIHEHPPELGATVPQVLRCVRCQGKMVYAHDVNLHGTLRYYDCTKGHGRWISYAMFLREKGFVRTLRPPELNALKATIKIIRCDACGASVDIRQHDACNQCRSPLAILDAESVKKALAEYTHRPANQLETSALLAEALMGIERARTEGHRGEYLRDIERPTVLAVIPTAFNLIGGILAAIFPESDD